MYTRLQLDNTRYKHTHKIEEIAEDYAPAHKRRLRHGQRIQKALEKAETQKDRVKPTPAVLMTICANALKRNRPSQQRIKFLKRNSPSHYQQRITKKIKGLYKITEEGNKRQDAAILNPLVYKVTRVGFCERISKFYKRRK